MSRSTCVASSEADWCPDDTSIRQSTGEADPSNGSWVCPGRLKDDLTPNHG